MTPSSSTYRDQHSLVDTETGTASLIHTDTSTASLTQCSIANTRRRCSYAKDKCSFTDTPRQADPYRDQHSFVDTDRCSIADTHRD